MNTQNKYGYKVCYREYNKGLKMKIHLICNSYDLALNKFNIMKITFNTIRKLKN